MQRMGARNPKTLNPYTHINIMALARIHPVITLHIRSNKIAVFDIKNDCFINGLSNTGRELVGKNIIVNT